MCREQGVTEPGIVPSRLETRALLHGYISSGHSKFERAREGTFFFTSATAYLVLSITTQLWTSFIRT